MTTFILKKYAEDQVVQTSNDNPNPESNDVNDKENKENLDRITISTTGSISGIVATALGRVFKNTNVSIEKFEDTVDSDIKVISSDSINKDPADTFNAIHKNDTILICNNGFTTLAEEWFLTNIPNKTENVFYTPDSFARHIKTRLLG